jgi:SAM-dependent methyltransferase
MPDVRKFWDDRADNEKLDDNAVTHSDIWQRWLEIETISSYLQPTDILVDIGCGAGYATRHYAPLVKKVVGLDFSSEMIRRAQSAPIATGAIEFLQFDILEDVSKWKQSFDAAVSTRCLINILDVEKQHRAIDNIARMLRPGGRFIFVEGCRDGRQQLNELRESMGLRVMPTVWHNLDFDLAETFDYMNRDFRILERRSFGSYDLISRVVHPLLVMPDEPKYDSKINEVGARLARISQGDPALSRILFLVLERK